MVSSRFYDVAYRWGWAPWDGVGVRDELLALLPRERSTSECTHGSAVARLARPGAVMLFWCCYAARHELPRVSVHGPSRLTPAIEPGEEEQLFGQDFEIADFSRPHPNAACFLLHRRAGSPSA